MIGIVVGASSLTALIVLRVVHGSATAVFGPVASATVSEIWPPSLSGAPGLAPMLRRKGLPGAVRSQRSVERSMVVTSSD